MKIPERKAFTLVEILVVCGVVSVFLGTAILLFTNFRRGYSRSENTAVLMQESALFLARLRTDLNNAVLSGDFVSVPLEQQLNSTSDKLQFLVYSSQEGKTIPVTYTLRPGRTGGSLYRKESGASERELIKDHVASLSWQAEVEKFATAGSGTMRLSINLDLQLKADSGSSEKPFSIKTNIFPARMNRQLNNP